MALQKQTYINDETVITAEQLNAIQDAIIENEKTIADLSAASGSDSNNVVIVTVDEDFNASMTSTEIIEEITAGKVAMLTILTGGLSAPLSMLTETTVVASLEQHMGGVVVILPAVVDADGRVDIAETLPGSVTVPIPESKDAGKVLAVNEEGGFGWANVDTGSSGDSDASNVVIVTTDEATGKASMTASEIVAEINADKVVFLNILGSYTRLGLEDGVSIVTGILEACNENGMVNHFQISVLDDGSVSLDYTKMSTTVPSTGETGNVLTFGENGPEWGNIDAGSSGDSSIYVGTDEPTDENVQVWINPEGDSDADSLVTEAEVDALIEAKLGVIENGAY